MLALILFILLTAVTAVAVWQEAQNAINQPTLASFSNEPEGARALYLYLKEIGYNTSDAVRHEFTIPDAANVMLLLEPMPGITEGEWETIDEWVRDGGTLVIAGWDFGTSLAMGHYDTRLGYLWNQQTAVSLQAPLLTSPPLPADAPLTTEATLATDRKDIAVHLATDPEGLPVMVSFAQGDGRVILSTMPQVFTNQGLKVKGHPEVALNHITAAGDVKMIWFDEWHHGIRPEVTASNNWLQRTPAGRALLYAGVVIFMGLVLRGRIFGRPIPLPQETGRRAPIEYISGIANLSRRAGQRTAVLQDYHHRLKRELGYRYRLNPTLPDAEFVRQLAAYEPDLDIVALQNLLARLSTHNVSEHELVELAAKAAEFGKQ